jgi:hypothetical protein
LLLSYHTCKPAHIKAVVAQEHDAYNKVLYASADFAEILSCGFAVSAWAGVRCVGVAGILPVNKFRAIAWSLLGSNAGPYLTHITKRVRLAIDSHPCRRIEMTVKCDFEQGHRWARLLGMTCEAERMVSHGVFGEDEALYAKVKA